MFVFPGLNCLATFFKDELISELPLIFENTLVNAFTFSVAISESVEFSWAPKRVSSFSCSKNWLFELSISRNSEIGLKDWSAALRYSLRALFSALTRVLKAL